MPETALERSRTQPGEPIAVVGMACRFPGAPDLPAFWRLLDGGVSAVTEGVPGSGVGRVGELFPDAATQNSACRFGAFIDGIDQFDAAFFRISPVEAQLLDPQQRLMLEVSWQALEDAGIDPDGLKGSRTGVYAGISNNEYRALVLDGNDTAEPAASLYSVAGTSFNTAIGRVAFALGLRGPAMAVDTACSSSLAAVHQAVSGLQRGEADLALAGGVHAILSGRLFELRGNAGMLAPDGRCKTFDADGQRLRAGRGMRDPGTEAPRRCRGRRRPDLGRHPGHSPEPGRCQPGPHRPERRGPAAGDRRCPGLGRCRARRRGLRGDPWHGHPGGRSDRGRGHRHGLLRRTGPSAVDRVGQDQRRPSGVGGRRGQPDQGDAGHEAWGHPLPSQLP